MYFQYLCFRIFTVHFLWIPQNSQTQNDARLYKGVRLHLSPEFLLAESQILQNISLVKMVHSFLVIKIQGLDCIIAYCWASKQLSTYRCWSLTIFKIGWRQISSPNLHDYARHILILSLFMRRLLIYCLKKKNIQKHFPFYNNPSI